MSKKCECGAEKCGTTHSDWCPVNNENFDDLEEIKKIARQNKYKVVYIPKEEDD
jgi:hypothetical protein